MNTRWFKEQVLSLSPDDFEDLALALFEYQATHNALYAEYLQYLKVRPSQVLTVAEIPCLPIQFFKYHRVQTGHPPDGLVFESSGTTGQVTSRHYVSDVDFYRTLSQQIFEQRYGPLRNWELLALLPSYLERQNSSLVCMVQHFIEQTASEASGFFLNNTTDLLRILRQLSQSSRPVLLWGVAFALLDLAEQHDLSFLKETSNLTVLETGGMKGRRRELIREELHGLLTERFGVRVIHSEYGMTELLSQGYSGGEGIFELPASMQIRLRNPSDPFECWNEQQPQRRGGINVIDLGNVDSCCFIETQDLGSYVSAKTTQFSVLGRFDNADVRGCNLMVS